MNFDSTEVDRCELAVSGGVDLLATTLATFWRDPAVVPRCPDLALGLHSDGAALVLIGVAQVVASVGFERVEHRDAGYPSRW